MPLLAEMAAEFEAQVAAELTVLLLLRAGCDDNEVRFFAKYIDKEPNGTRKG